MIAPPPPPYPGRANQPTLYESESELWRDAILLIGCLLIMLGLSFFGGFMTARGKYTTTGDHCIEHCERSSTSQT